MTTIDGSAVSNGAFLIIGNGSTVNADSFTGGSGDDTFRFDGTTHLATNDTIAGGGGSDTINLQNDAAVTGVINFNVVTGTVEKVEIYTVDGVTSGAADIQIVVQ